MHTQFITYSNRRIIPCLGFTPVCGGGLEFVKRFIQQRKDEEDRKEADRIFKQLQENYKSWINSDKIYEMIYNIPTQLIYTTKNMKKGQIITAESPRGKSIYILGEDGEVVPPSGMRIIIGKSHIDGLTFNERSYVHQDVTVRLATPEEGRGLFDFIEKNGWKYDSKTMAAVKIEEEAFVANDGDFCLSGGGCPFIAKDVNAYHISAYIGINIDANVSLNSECFTTSIRRLLTPTEKSDFLCKLSAAGYEWNATEKRVEKKLWRAKEDGEYWTVENVESVENYDDMDDTIDRANYASGNYFQTESEAKEYLEKVKNVFLERKLIK